MNCSHNIYEVDDGFTGTAKQIAEYLGITSTMVHSAERDNKKTKGHHIKLAKYGRNKETEYEIYEGEEKIFVGTGTKIAEKFGVTPTTVRNANYRVSKDNKAKLLWKYTVKKISNFEEDK